MSPALCVPSAITFISAPGIDATVPSFPPKAMVPKLSPLTTIAGLSKFVPLFLDKNKYGPRALAP